MTAETVSETIFNARRCAYAWVEETNHKYGEHPYTFHLEMVVGESTKFIDLIPVASRADVIAACWLHDSIEDHRKSYNDIKRATNEAVAEIVYAVTTEKGRTRADRANDRYYHGIRQCPFAPFVKCCDRLANIRGSEGKMFAVYRNEADDFAVKLQRYYLEFDCRPLFDEMALRLHCW